MNYDLAPALIAATGGPALLAGIWAHEYHRDAQMRTSRTRLALRFPINLETSSALAALDGLGGLPYTSELLMELTATEEATTHALCVPAAVRGGAASVMQGAVPRLRLSEQQPHVASPVTLALRLSVPTPCLLGTEHAVEASRALLSGVAALGKEEALTLLWALCPGRPLPPRESAEPGQRESEVARAWRHKTATTGFTAEGLLLVRAASRLRARELATQTLAVVRGRHSLGRPVRVTAGSGSSPQLPWCRRTSGWLTSAELLPLLGWPLGAEAIHGVEVGASRELLVPRHLAQEGRQLFVGRDARGERPVALPPEAARHHVALAGSSGSGKSTLLATSVLSDLACGHAGVVIDPKADLVQTILERVKPEHADRVVVLDPGDLARAVPGIDVLRGGDPDARADVLTRTLKSIVPDWGIRSEIWGRLAIRTLAEVPSATLLDLGRLFSDEAYRRAAVARLRDDYLIASWQNYEELSPAAKVDVVQAPMARVMALLARPRVRAVLASPQPKLDVASLLQQRKFLLVSLAPGVLGEASNLIGSAVMYAVWSAIEARAALPVQRRHLINLYVDELATLTSGLPNSFDLIAERARGLGASLTVAVQTLSRIPEPTRSALLGNAATFITWRAPAEEAERIARQLPGLSAGDVMALGRFEVAARIGTGTGGAVSVVTGHTEPLGPPGGQAKRIRDRSAQLYGAPPRQAESAAPDPTSAKQTDEGPAGRVRRAS